MDSLTLAPAETPPSDNGSSLGSSMPGFAPLAMPAQSFRRFSRRDRRAWVNPRPGATPVLARLAVYGGAVALTAYGAYQMYRVVGVGTTTLLEWVMVVLFVITFSWLALSFTASVVGFIWLLTHSRKPGPLPASLTEKTAVVMPIYNEAPSRVFGAMQAILEDVERAGLGAAFDFF
jgi:membrane glycosyltransferase